MKHASADPPSPLEALRRRLALPVGEHAVFDGWSRAAVDAAADQLGMDRAQARLAMPKSRAGMVDEYVQAVDRALEEHFTPKRLAGMKIRDKIRGLVWQRFLIMLPAREAVRRGLAVLATPQNLPRAMRIGWRTADVMWRLAGDTSTDFNHYTKRMTLGAVYASSLLVWLDDDSEGLSETADFLDRRIDDVMKFEKWKSNWRGSGEHVSVARFLGRLRYPPR